jgi:hypothetical protein
MRQQLGDAEGGRMGIEAEFRRNEGNSSVLRSLPTTEANDDSYRSAARRAAVFRTVFAFKRCVSIGL